MSRQDLLDQGYSIPPEDHNIAGFAGDETIAVALHCGECDVATLGDEIVFPDDNGTGVDIECTGCGTEFVMNVYGDQYAQLFGQKVDGPDTGTMFWKITGQGNPDADDSL